MADFYSRHLSNVRDIEEERFKRRKRHIEERAKVPAKPAKKKKQPKMKSHLKHKGDKDSIDYILFSVIMLLLLFGLVMVFSSSYYYALTSSINNMYHFIQRQFMWGSIGVVGMIIMMNFNYRFIKKFTVIGYIFIVACLVLVLIVGTDINGSKRWLGVSETLGFQPSEVAKFVIIVCLAHYISANKNCLATFKGFVRCCIIWVIPTALVAIENLSTALVISGISVCIMFVASPKIWYFVTAAGAGSIGIAAMLLMPDFAYRLNRIKYWLDPFSDPTDKGFQIIQGLYAVASGGLFGLGLGQSRQKTYLPEPYNDMIFAIICEELGMVGAGIVLILFGVFIWRSIKIAMNSQDVFGCLTATGLCALIGIQVIINIAVATNSMPNTGMQLPFISYGGSGLVFTLAGMGILLNISRYQRINLK